MEIVKSGKIVVLGSIWDKPILDTSWIKNWNNRPKKARRKLYNRIKKETDNGFVFTKSLRNDLLIIFKTFDLNIKIKESKDKKSYVVYDMDKQIEVMNLDFNKQIYKCSQSLWATYPKECCEDAIFRIMQEALTTI